MSGERFEKEFSEMMALLERHDSVLVTGHIDPDGDCIGSMFAIALMLEKMDKKVVCYAPGEISELFLKLPGASMLAVRPSVWNSAVSIHRPASRDARYTPVAPESKLIATAVLRPASPSCRYQPRTSVASPQKNRSASSACSELVVASRKIAPPPLFSATKLVTGLSPMNSRTRA